MNQLVSVVIPVFNQSHFLGKAIESVLKQSISNFEIIVVDDGSSDKPENVLELYPDPRIHLTRQKNLGLSAARNSGIAQSNADFIAFLDADDTWCPQFLESLLNYLLDNPNLGVAFCLCNFIDKEGNPLSRGPRPPHSRLKNVTAFWLHRSTPHGCGSTFMIRKEILEITGAFDQGLPAYEDIEFFLRVLRKSSFKISGINKVLASYRLHASSLSTNYSLLEKCLLSIVNEEDDKNSCLSFFNRYIAQREMLSSGSRIQVILRLLASLRHSLDPWKVDFYVSLLTFLAAILYLVFPKRVFFQALKLHK